MTDSAILDGILAREGGYVDHAADRGQCTKYGITLGALHDWRGKQTTCDDVRALTEAEAREIYTVRYLRPFDGVDAALKPHVVDIAVNSGVSRARALLAMAQQGPKPIGVQLVIERLKHYGRIVKNDPSQRVFLPGWIARATDFL